MNKKLIESACFPTWCPGCGNFGIWAAVKQAISELEINYENLVFVYGVGCHGNMADFIKAYGFHGLHGRALPLAAGIKLANHKLTVICQVGDGDCLGEGMGHFIAAIRANYDIKILIHNNGVYGLTTGQTSPTSQTGFVSKSTPSGVIEKPVNPTALAILSGATFVARSFTQNINLTKNLIKAAILHSGISVIDLLQPCVSFNKKFGYDFFREKTYELENHNSADFQAALNKSLETLDRGRIPLGLFYEEKRKPYHVLQPAITDKSLVELQNPPSIKSLIAKFS